MMICGGSLKADISLFNAAGIKARPEGVAHLHLKPKHLSRTIPAPLAFGRQELFSEVRLP